LNDYVKEDEMGRACSKYGGEEYIDSFGGKSRREVTTRILGIRQPIILK
jgi:hypothetical protein